MQVRVEGPDGAADWEIEADPAATLAEVLRAVGCEAAGAHVDGRWHAAGSPFAETGAATGSVVRVCGPGTAGEAGGPALAVVAGPDAGHRVTVRAGTTVGRGDADVRLGDPALSARHARVRVDDGGVATLEDLGSTNGTTCDHAGAFRLGRSVLRLEPGPAATPRRAGGEHHRPPRVAAPPAVAPLAVPAAPAEPDRPRLLVSTLAVPLLTGAVLASLYGPRMAVIAVVGPAVALAGWVGARVSTTRRTGRAERAHRRALTELAAAAVAARDAELARRLARHPDVLTVVDRARARDPRLWERRPADDDFLVLRLGRGDVPWQVPTASTPDDAARAALAAAEVLRSAPITVDGRGLVGVCGPRSMATALARALVAQVAVFHGPADVSVAVFASTAAAGDWLWTRWLPHLADPADPARRLLALGATQAADAAARLAGSPPGDALRWLVVDGDDEDLGRHGALRALVAGGAGVVVASDRTRLPSTCAAVVAVDETGVVTLHAPAPEPAHGLLDGLGVDVADELARALAPLRDPEADGGCAEIPRQVSLLTLLDAGDAGAAVTAAGVEARWAATRGTDELVVPIGAGGSGAIVVDLVRDGPHALIAGTTGSGKSELLRTLVASLAASADTEHCNLVLVDFKGGAAFDRLAALPHVVGCVTDLDEHLAARALRCLDAELRRREQVLRDARVGDVTEYVRRRRDDRSLEPLPRLVVVVDEFATLVSELPGFVDALVDLAQRGRSLGVHLVLATQRPAGAVKDSIRTNANLRVALRVVEPADARDVIGSDEAAFLPRDLPGRGYLRRGAGEPCAFQSALVGARTAPRAAARVTARPWRPCGDAPSPSAATDAPTDADALVHAVRAAHDACGHPAPRCPWPDPLPADLDAATLPRGAFGLVDRPGEQRVDALSWAAGSGNVAVSGLTGSGVTTTLRSLAVALASDEPPERLHLYAAGNDVAAFEDLASLPHCGGVVPYDDVERSVRLLRVLDGELRRRRRPGRERAPRIVTLLDDIGSLRRTLDEASLLDESDRLERVVADGPAHGIVFAIGADHPNALGHRLERTIAQRLLLRLADRADYLAIGLHDVAPHRLPPGRGFLASGEEVQVATFGADAVRTIASATRPDAIGRGRPLAVGRLPERVDVAAAGAHASCVGGAVSLAIGVGDRRLDTVGVTLRPGDHFLVTGPARSGKTATLRTIAHLLRAAGVDVIDAATDRRNAVAPTPAELHALADRALGGRGPAVVIVDDADLLDDGGALMALVQPGRPDLHVVAAGRGDRLRGLFRHWTAEVRRSRLGLLLRGDELDGDLLGARVPRRAVAPWRPGRGWLVTDDDVELCQVAWCGRHATDPEHRSDEEEDRCA